MTWLFRNRIRRVVSGGHHACRNKFTERDSPLSCLLQEHGVVNERILESPNLCHDSRGVEIDTATIHTDNNTARCHRSAAGSFVDAKANVHVRIRNKYPVAEIANLQDVARVQVRLASDGLCTYGVVNRMIREGVSRRWSTDRGHCPGQRPAPMSQSGTGSVVRRVRAHTQGNIYVVAEPTLHYGPQQVRIPDDLEHRFRAKLNTDSRDVEHGFRDVEHRFRAS